MRILSFNRLVLQSGLTTGVGRLAFVAVAAAVIVFFGTWWARDDLFEASVIAVVSSVLLPYIGLRLLKARRQGRFGTQFPNAIDIIVRSLRAGHPVPVAISMVARELPDPVGTEFGIVADEITYGADLETAMRNLAYRVGQEDLPLFVTAVAIQGSTGGNLSEILENLSKVIRDRFKMRRKVKALAAEGKFSALFLSGLPIAIFFMIRYVAPEFYGSVWKYEMTKIGLGMAAGWMLMGNLVMYRMVNFRI
jgi:tight adherence protein B